MRFLFGFVGCAIIAAVAHVSIFVNGGYGTPQAPLTIAVACGVAVGSIALAYSIADRRWLFALGFVIVLLGGETYNMILTGERVLASRDAAAEPARLLMLKRKAAEQKLKEAKAVVIATTPRLEAAMASKEKAETAIATSAKEKTCVKNCNELLTKAVNDAAAEVNAARAELGEQQRAAQRAIETAQAAVEALPAPKSETLFADKLTIAGSTLDLFTAFLASLGANGLGALLLAFAVHRHPAKDTGKPATAETKLPLTYFSADLETQSVPQSAPEHAAKFGLECLKPGGRTSYEQLLTGYLDWCSTTRIAPLPLLSIAEAMGKLFSETPGIGIDEDKSGCLYVTGLQLRRSYPAPQKALLALPRADGVEASVVNQLA